MKVFSSVKKKLIISILTFTLLCVGVPIFLLVQQFQKNFNQRTEVLIDATFEMFKNQITLAMVEKDKNVQKVLDNLSMNKSINQIRIFKEDGIISYSTNDSEINTKISLISPHDQISFFPDNRITKLSQQEGLFSITDQIINEDLCRNCHSEDSVIAYLDIDLDLTKAETFFYTGSNHMMFVAIAGMIILALSLIYLFNRLINNPLFQIKQAVDKIKGGDYQVKLPSDRVDEFGLVFNHFNKMVEQINSSRSKIEELHFERLQRVNRLKMLGELTSQTAHEINNLVAIIMTRADFIKMESENNAQLKEYAEDIDVILNQSGKLSSITNNVLRHSKKSKIDFVKFNLSNQLNNCLQLLNPVLKKRNIKVTRQFYNDEIIVNGDPLLIEQVLINLINNSIDAIEENGNINIDLEKRNNSVQLLISDDGCGIEKDYIDQIFSPFFSLKDKDKGSGLGLYIVKQICDIHKITISCESKINEGTKFKLIFNSNEQ